MREYVTYTHDAQRNMTPVPVRLSDLLRYAETYGHGKVARALLALRDGPGIAYSGQDFDILSAAWADMGWPRVWD
jgi:hypothetical protein